MRRFSFLVSLVLLVSCSGSDGTTPTKTADATDTGATVVYTVNYPLSYFAERIGGDAIEVRFPVPENVDPAFWSPGPDEIAGFQEADLILLNGAGYAGWVDRATLPASRLVDTSSTFRDRYVVTENAAVHTHGPEGEHSHGEIAFTTWLDPNLAVEQARAIRDAFVRERPQLEKEFDEGFAALESDLRALDREIEKIVAGNRVPILASHPIYQYLARRYGLNLRSVHFEPDEPPSRTAWHDLQQIIETHKAGWMLWEGEPLGGTLSRLRELGVESVVFDPCGNRPADGDLLTAMRRNVTNLERVF